MQLPFEITALLFIGTVLYGFGLVCLAALAAITAWEVVAYVATPSVATICKNSRRSSGDQMASKL